MKKMAEQMIRKDSDKPGQKSIVDDNMDKQVTSEKGKKPERGKGKASVTKRSQTRATESPVTVSSPRVDRDQSDLCSVRTDTSKASRSTSNDNNDNSQILAMLKVIQENQDIQGKEMKTLSSRMAGYENDYDEEYEDAQEHDNDEYDDTHEDHDQVDATPNKRKADDNSLSKFASMAKRVKTRETLGAKIDETLADNVTDLFRNGMNEDQFIELTKDENTPRPENCEGLAIVKTNQLIWDIISPQAQSVERKMQVIQKAIVKASTVLVNTVNKMASTDENNNTIDECNDALAILGHANRKVNITRRELIKPEMSFEYIHLCSQSVEYTSNLFGDDVQKRAKEIEDCSKISNKIQSGSGGHGGYNSGYGYNRFYSRRGVSGSYGRGRGSRRSRGGRGGRGRGSAYRSGGNHSSAETPKNPLRRGGFQNNKDRN